MSKNLNKNKYGQYFTPVEVAKFMVELADVDINAKILEPSCGEGVFLDVLSDKGFKNLSAYEIDKDLGGQYSFIKYKSFVTANIEDSFDLIIGNPPYIRWKNLEEELKQELSSNELWNKYFNSLCDYLYIFILKSIKLLNDGGQLIFICPEYWMNTTHSITLRNYMVKHGYFEQIYHFNETPIFDKANVSTIIFKYIKGGNRVGSIKLAKYHTRKKPTYENLLDLKNETQIGDVEYLQIPQFIYDERWLLESVDVISKLKLLEQACQKNHQKSLEFLLNDENNYHKIGDFCDIGNGLVSGLDKAFKLDTVVLNNKEKSATLKVVKAKDIAPYHAGQITNYIFLPDDLDEESLINFYPNFYSQLKEYKNQLEKRYQYNRKINYWEWVFLRNFKLFSKQEARIFVPCKDRISHKKYFRFAMADKDMFPTQDVTAIFRKDGIKESLEYILSYLNQPFIFDWLKSNGIVKGSIVEFSEKPISSIPFRKIDWSNSNDTKLHDEITNKTKLLLETKNASYIEDINSLFIKLLGIKNNED